MYLSPIFIVINSQPALFYLLLPTLLMPPDYYCLKKFVYLFITVELGLHCCTRALSSCSNWGLLLVVVYKPLLAAASLVVEDMHEVHGLQ